MFRLNGDIIKQLENIYHIKFHQKYKGELKERILFFLHTKLKNYLNEDIFLSIKNMNEAVLFVDNEPNLIKSAFIEKYKEEIFNSFNPLWYVSEIKIDMHLSSKDLNIQLNLLKLSVAIQLDDLDLFDIEDFPTFSEVGYLYSYGKYEIKHLSTNQLKDIEKKLNKDFFYRIAPLFISSSRLDLFKEFISNYSVDNKIKYFDFNKFCQNNKITNVFSKQFYHSFLHSFIVYETINKVKTLIEEREQS